ncbi:MAG: hypothetical protein KDD35_06045, partial [Bdellovibrionales bacterium]|nr:hypothetical protein [Bdellovibrionales bacterium]
MKRCALSFIIAHLILRIFDLGIADAAWGPPPLGLPAPEPRKISCLENLNQAVEKGQLRHSASESHDLLNAVIESDGIALWVKEAQEEAGESRTIPSRFIFLIHEYRELVKEVLLDSNYKYLSNSNRVERIFRILSYNISAVSSGLVPTDWVRESLELNYFLTDQLDLLRDLLGEHISNQYETIQINNLNSDQHVWARTNGNDWYDVKKSGSHHRRSLTAIERNQAKEFINVFESLVSPLLKPQFGIRIVFQSCYLIYDLMVKQRYFQMVKRKSTLSLHSLLQDALLYSGTHPYILLYFWDLEPRLFMDKDFPNDDFFFRRKGAFKNKLELEAWLDTFVMRSNDQLSLEWSKYDSFDPFLSLNFGSEAIKQEKGRDSSLLKSLQAYTNRHVSDSNSLRPNMISISLLTEPQIPSDSLSRLFPNSKAVTDFYNDLYDVDLINFSSWSASLLGRASSLKIFLSRAGHFGYLLKFKLEDSNSPDLSRLLEFVTSRNSYVPSKQQLGSKFRRKALRGIEYFMTHFSSLYQWLNRDRQMLGKSPNTPERKRITDQQGKSPYKTPPLPELKNSGVPLILPSKAQRPETHEGEQTGSDSRIHSLQEDEAVNLQVEIQELGSVYRHLAQENELLYSWIMDEKDGVGHIIR